MTEPATDPAPIGRQRVVILSDTHGELDRQIADMVTECDLAVHGGDIGGVAVLARLLPRSGRVYAVRGNNDVPRAWSVDERPYLAHLPDVVSVELCGGVLVVIHGHQFPAASRHAQLRARFPQARAIVYGHSHHLVVDTDESPWVLNPGAAGRVRTYGGPSCLVLSATETNWSLAVHRFAPSRAGRGRSPFVTCRPELVS